jgi:phenylacetate-CoA ligase
MLEDVRQRIAQAIERIVGVRVGLRLVEPHSIERSQGKAKRVIDQRGD